MGYRNGKQPRAFITGIAGQDGSYLAEFLLHRGYTVVGLERMKSMGAQHENLTGIINDPNLILLEGDITDANHLRECIQKAQPDEVYNLAAQSSVHASWNRGANTSEVNYMATMSLLDACRTLHYSARIYQASSSEMYGNQPSPLNEQSPMIPASPYGVSKLAAHRLCGVYREAHSMFISCGICFNHESPRRGPEFLTRKVAIAVAEIKSGKRSSVSLGNLNSCRDWGYAGDYVLGMWAMLQQPEPDDFVLATGKSYTVEDYVASAFAFVGLDYEEYVIHDPGLLRPGDIACPVGDSTKAWKAFGWDPQVNFSDLVGLMVKAELEK